MIGQTVSHYAILERLGGGAMGEVYKGQDTRLKRVVALKFLHDECSRDSETKLRFMQEAQAASSLDHPNICVVHDIGETDRGRVFIVMAYCPGRTVKQMLETGPLPIEQAISITRQVASGLAAAHRQRIVHRDVKPANLIVTDGGIVKILDFGLAKLADSTDITRAGMLLGTPAYMSPEQTRGSDVDHRTDVWSLGVVIYEMLTGRRPFGGSTPQAVIHAIINETPEPIDAGSSEPRAKLAGIALKALSRPPAVRYQRMEELLAALPTAGAGLESLTMTWTGFFPQPEQSIAVLPFANMSADARQDYFCDGMAEELINALSRVEGLHVVARTSAFAFKGQYADVREIGARLGVRTVLEGSVRTAGSRLRISAQLVNVDDGFHLWSETYDRDMQDLFAVQDEISRAIVDSLKVELLEPSTTELVKRHTDDIEAYNLYLKGRYHWSQRAEPELKSGIRYFEAAIAKDPGYALAYAGLADSFNLLGFYGHEAPADTFPRAKQSAEKALELDDRLAEAHTSLAFSAMYHDWDWERAESSFRRALELNPSYATAHHWYAEFLAVMGRRDESLAEANRALKRDPLSLIINTLIGWVWYYARDYDEAIRRLEKTLRHDTSFVPAHLWLGLAYQRTWRYEDAIATLEKGLALSRHSVLLGAALGMTFAAAGHEEKARELMKGLEERRRSSYVAPYHLAALSAALGDVEQSRERLDESLQGRDTWLVFLNVDPVWDGVRFESWFVELAGTIGLPG